MFRIYKITYRESSIREHSLAGTIWRWYRIYRASGRSRRDALRIAIEMLEVVSRAHDRLHVPKHEPEVVAAQTPRAFPLSDLQIKEILRLSEEGYSATQISRTLSLAHSRVVYRINRRKRLEREEVETAQRAHRVTEDLENMERGALPPEGEDT